MLLHYGSSYMCFDRQRTSKELDKTFIEMFLTKDRSTNEYHGLIEGE